MRRRGSDDRRAVTVPFMLRDAPSSQAPRVRCPVLVVRGTRDWIVSVRAARRLAAALPAGAYVEVPRVAHAVQFDRPDAFTELLLPFVGTAEAAPALFAGTG
jgi:pimeloyl-ACP methyl ester carboxylesterase